MAIMMYIFDKSGKELAKGVFGATGASPIVDGERDHSKRMSCRFSGKDNLTASSFGLDEIKVKIWGPGDGPGNRYTCLFTVGAA